MKLPVISFEFLTRTLRTVLKKLPDARTGKNAQYTMLDAASGAFSVFFTQCPSFLSYQQLLQKRHGLSNAKTLFGMDDIPSDTHIRTLLDTVSPTALDGVFTECIEQLEKLELLKPFRTALKNHDYLIALDGTEYFSSETIHCRNCSTKEKDGKIIYSHMMINPALVVPDRRQAIALPPEFIIPQDGDKKQDCENKAAKRWINKHGKTYAHKHVTLLGDDLYCHQPMCEAMSNAGFNFILTCKPDSHKTLYEWLNGITETKTINKHNKGHREKWIYRYCQGVPLKDGEGAISVNWCELTIEREGKRIFKNAFVTNHAVNQETVETIVACGRSRWKTENENNNTLKTKGYHLDHNYGHGKKHLSALLAALNILAFLFHTILEMTDELYQLLRKIAGSRVRFFEEMRTLLKFFPCRSFHHLMQFMMTQLENPKDISMITVPI